MLLTTSTLPIGDVAFAAGFASIRQFNDTVRDVFARTPTDMRRVGGSGHERQPGVISVRLAVRMTILVSGHLLRTRRHVARR